MPFCNIHFIMVWSWLAHFKWILCFTALLMYLQNAFDEFQMIKICPCEITKNKLHEWVCLVIFSYNANLNILPVKLTDSHRKESEYKKKIYIYMYVCVCITITYYLEGHNVFKCHVMFAWKCKIRMFTFKGIKIHIYFCHPQNSQWKKIWLRPIGTSHISDTDFYMQSLSLFYWPCCKHLHYKIDITTLQNVAKVNFIKL